MMDDAVGFLVGPELVRNSAVDAGDVAAAAFVPTPPEAVRGGGRGASRGPGRRSLGKEQQAGAMRADEVSAPQASPCCVCSSAMLSVMRVDSGVGGRPQVNARA